FVVRRHKVGKALEWLIRNNPLYSGVQLCQARLAALPENAIPDQLYAITRISDDTEGLHSEGMNYVPQHDDDPAADAPEGEYQYVWRRYCSMTSSYHLRRGWS